MALRDHSLDSKITTAAKEEFLISGYQKASLHKISEKAGITTGALYTRYKGKDDLFCSLLQDLFVIIEKKSADIALQYQDVMKSSDPSSILKIIKSEEKVYIDLLFEHYDECLLLFCKSDGSSIEKQIKEMTRLKVKSTIEYIKSISQKDVNLSGLELVMESQFNIFRNILEKGYKKEEAVSCVESAEAFYEAGWKDLFSRII